MGCEAGSRDSPGEQDGGGRPPGLHVTVSPPAARQTLEHCRGLSGVLQIPVGSWPVSRLWLLWVAGPCLLISSQGLALLIHLAGLPNPVWPGLGLPFGGPAMKVLPWVSGCVLARHLCVPEAPWTLGWRLCLREVDREVRGRVAWLSECWEMVLRLPVPRPAQTGVLEGQHSLHRSGGSGGPLLPTPVVAFTCPSASRGPLLDTA